MGPENLPLAPRNSLLVPARLELEEKMIVWEWDHFGEPRENSRDRIQENCEDVLESFTALAGGQDTPRGDAGKVLEFAQEYGPLYLCKSHGLPLPHAGDWLGQQLASQEGVSSLTGAVRFKQGMARARELGVLPSPSDGSDSSVSRSGPCTPSGREPVEQWLYLAERVQTVFQIGRKLRDGERLRKMEFEPLVRVERGSFLSELTRRTTPPIPGVEEKPVRIPPPKANTPEQQQQRFRKELQRLLQMSGLQVTLEYLDQEADLVRLRWDGVGVFSRIVADLVRGLHDRLTTICYECGRVFQADKKKRPAGRKHYCSDECRDPRSKYSKRKARSSGDDS